MIKDNITLLCGDCMEYMRTLPDNAFDLAVVDPPYGDGNFQAPPSSSNESRWGGWFSRYKRPLEQVRCEVRPIQTSRADCGLSRDVFNDIPGITPPKIKQLYHTRRGFGGILLPTKSISKSCFELVVIRLFGAVITSLCRQLDVFLFGVNYQYLRNSVWQCANMLGLHSMPMQNGLSVHRRVKRRTQDFIRHKSR